MYTSRWKQLWSALGVAHADETLFRKIIARYSEPHRKYHTLRHLEECLGHLDQVRHLAARPAEIELALWFHDAIYDVRRQDNEDRSAEWARASADAASLPVEVCDRLQHLVLATRHNGDPESVDEAILLDIDFSILGASPQRFEEYEIAIREEYNWVPRLVFGVKMSRRSRSNNVRLRRIQALKKTEYRERQQYRRVRSIIALARNLRACLIQHSSSAAVKILYHLRNDLGRIAKAQAATLSSKPFGLKATHGLFGSEGWWRNIETGVIPMERYRGRITRLFRAGMHNESPCFEMMTDDGELFEYDCVVANRADRKLYQLGARIEISCVSQELKKPVLTTSGEVSDTHSRCLIEVRVDSV